MDIKFFADLYSTTPLGIYFTLTYLSIINTRIDEFKFCLYLILSNYIVSKIKRLPYPKSLYQITRRPIGSSNCDYLSRNGPQSPDAPGFPSGHMTTIAFFSTYQILQNTQPSLYFKGTHISLVLIMGWARYYKKCHNMLQISVGTLFGICCGYFYKYYIA